MDEKPIFVRHHLTEALIERLLKMQRGEVISYLALAKVIGQSVQEKPGYDYLYSARLILEKNHNMVFDPIIGEGLKFLEHRETVQTTARTTRRINRLARRQRRRLQGVDFQALNQAEIKVAMHGISVMGFLQEQTITRKEHDPPRNHQLPSFKLE